MTDALALTLGADPFTIGRARYEDCRPTGKPTGPTGARIWVRVQPVDLIVLADLGLNLDVQATFAIGEAGVWPPRLVLLGFGGLLDRIRLGLDPLRNHVYFGPP